MQAIIPTASKAELLAVLQANSGKFDSAIEQLLQVTEEPSGSVTGDTTDFETHQSASKIEMPGLLSLEEQNSVMRMRRIFPLKSIQNCLLSLRENGGNTDQALDQLMKELEERGATLFTFDAAPTPVPVVPNSRVQVQRSYTPTTPPNFIIGARAEFEHRPTIKTVCPCSVSGHKCKLEEICGKMVVCNVSSSFFPFYKQCTYRSIGSKL